MKTEVVTYQHDGKSYDGFLSYNDEVKGSRPCIIVAHAWKGQDEFARKKTEALADMGYVGFAVDLFGSGKTVESDEEASAMIAPLFVDRQIIRNRMTAAYNRISGNELVDKSKIGAIGFCFGGLSVLELFRSGAKLKGTVSFHGLLGNTLGNMKANALPAAIELHGSVLILHGHLDPLVTHQDIRDFESEMTYAGVDWQVHIYGNASHAFSNPNADDPEGGLLYNKCADQRSWRAMRNFFEERFR